MFATIYNFFFKVKEPEEPKEPDTWVGVMEFNFYDDPKTKKIIKTTYLHLFETENGERYVDYTIKKDSWAYDIYGYKHTSNYNTVVRPWLTGLGIKPEDLTKYNPSYFKKETIEVKQEDNVFHIDPKKKE